MNYPIRLTHLRGSMVAGVMLAVVGAAASVTVLAQPPAGPRPGGQPGGGPRGGGQGFGRRGMGGRPLTVAMTPVSALAVELKLTDKQQKQIQQIQDQFRKDMMATASASMGGPGGPPPGAGGPGGPGGPGPRAGGPGGGRMGGMQGMDMQKMQALANKASTNVEGVLSPAQKKELPGALKEIGAMRQGGIPLETLGQLKLTSSEKTKITAISESSQKDVQAQLKGANVDFRSVMQQSRQKAHADVLAVLTPAQKSIIDKYEKEHPRGRGGFGGGFGGPGGRRGGPGGPGGPGGFGGPRPGGPRT